MERKQAKIRRTGMFFMVDALIASGILLVGLMLMSAAHINRQPVTHLSYAADDIIGVISELRINEINSTYTDELISNGSITRLNNTVMEQIGEFWSEEKIDEAANLTKEVLGDSVPSEYGYSLFVDDEKIFQVNDGINYTIASSRKVVSGYEKLKPVLGYTAKTYLTGTTERTSVSSVYFGGFVGEGNITAVLELPENLTEVRRAYIELVAGTDFKLYINGNYSGSYPQGSGNGTFLEPDMWELNESYLSSFEQGFNDIEIRFEYINENFTASGPKYIGGGFITVEYTTPDRTELGVEYYNGTANRKHRLPGITGFINLYSSIYVPGNLTGMKVFLNFTSYYYTYLTIGNVTVHGEDANGTTTVTINNSDIASIMSSEGISYSDLSMATIPIRLGLQNISRTSAPLDAVLATDVSGSMRWRMDQNNVNGVQRDCDDSDLNSQDTERLSVARCAGKDFIDTILNNEGPLVGLVSYESSLDSSVWLTDNQTELESELDSYSASGGTCICCGVNEAVQMLINDSQVTMISRRDEGWKYEDSDLASDPSGWTSAGFDDSSWDESQAALGYGYGGLNTVIARYEGNYYFRKKFNLTNASDISSLKLFVYSDDGADVYLNGNIIDNDYSSSHNAQYWNRDIDVNTSFLNEGENTVAVKLRNSETCFWIWCWPTNVAFDMELAGSSQQALEYAKKKAMIVMSDGEANVECAEQGNSGDMNNDGIYDNGEDDAIKAACDAYANYGITVYTVGFGSGADEATLEYMANCTDGAYFSSSDYDDLRDTYLIIADELIKFTETQRVNATDIITTELYTDSYIEFNYTPESLEPVYGQIPVTGMTAVFGNNISEGRFFVAEGNEILELAVTSYSGDMWTDTARISNSLGEITAFNLSSYGNIYRDIGDAFLVNIPVSYANEGENNTVTVKTSTGPGNQTGGSPFNRIVYTVRINSLLDYGEVLFTAEGCEWFVEFEDGTNSTLSIPSSYNGTNQCFYSNATYDTDDALDDAAYRLFSRLDFDSSGKLEIKLNENNLGIDQVDVSDVPSLWGPAVIEVRVW